MILNLYASCDTTLYENRLDSCTNTGLDEILTVGKELSGSFSTVPVNTRALLKFDLTSISSSIAAGSIPSGSCFFLKMKATEAKQIPFNYDLFVFPISQSWANGTGRFGNLPVTTDGASWKYRQCNVLWATESYATNTTASWSSIAGGGTYYTSSYVQQSFTTVTNDLNMDVTSLVNDWISGVIPNEGFILKRSDADEQSNTEQGCINFFSVDTNTIFAPKLEVAWDDSTLVASSSTLDMDSAVVYPSNLRQTYKEGSIPKICINARPKHPQRTFVTSSNYLLSYLLPTSSYYEVHDVRTNNLIISSSNFTKLSNDGTGNYFRFRTQGLEPERYYKFVIKTEDSEGGIQYFDEGYYFKVVR